MKPQLTFLTILCMGSFTAFNYAGASEVSLSEVSLSDKREYCKFTSELAGVINQGRYNGVSYSDIDEVTADNDQLNTIVNVVYQMDYFHSEEMRFRQTSELKNTVYKVCVETL